MLNLLSFQFLRLFGQDAPPLCNLPGEKYGFPTWYKYLQGQEDVVGRCQVMMDFTTGRTQSLLGIGLAGIEILLQLAGMVAIGFVIYGGFQYLMSQGEPDKTRSAKDTIMNAIIGLVIAIMATVIVRFIAGELTQ